MKIINTQAFKHALKDIHKNAESRKFCFVIGAGASRKSGIPTGGELAIKWFAEIEQRISKNEIDVWIKEQKISKKDLAASYGSIYRKRFENDKTSGYEFLVKAMKDSKPSVGHVLLAQILSKTSKHCIITTNFDSLIESSVYQFTNKTPLVCGHESLCGYARPSETHPLIIKIHRDLLLSPKSDPSEINKLDDGWIEPLDHIFSTHIPIVIGYGGNDGSLMSYFENMKRPSNFFWCGTDEKKISAKTEDVIEKLGGSFVQIEGFDELMYELLWVFDEIRPIKEELKDIVDNRIQVANEQFDAISNLKLEREKETQAINSNMPSKELSALEYANMADKENDLEKKKMVYLEALEKYPKTGWLWWRFTHFLQFIKKDYNGLKEYYQEALKYNKHLGGFLGNYAVYLSDIVRDYTKAEEYYLKGLEFDPDNSIINGNYGIFLKNIRKDYSRAEEYYLKALMLDPNNSSNNSNYAAFLYDCKNENERAEEFYLKALLVDADNVNANGNYANFLKSHRKDYEKAESYYLKALALDANHFNNNGNYANFLKTVRKDIVKAEEYYLKSLSSNPESFINNGNYAQLLLEKGDKLGAEKYIQKAFKSEEENDLLIELWFYRYCHYPEFLDQAEKKIEELLSKGIRSIGWDFSGNIKQAMKEKHPNVKKIEEFAKRISTK